MSRRVASLAVVSLVGLTLAGCAFNFFGYGERRAEWRDQEERACMMAGAVRESGWIQRVKRVRDRGTCGIDRPLQVSGLAGGRVSIGPTATINCPMTAAVERWLAQSVQPAAIAWFGSPVVSIKQISAYACRTKNSKRGASLSEHAYGNALDVAGFQLADGRSVSVLKGWNGDDANGRGFLREVLAASCSHFKTVLGPGVKYHADHFHFDLARHNKAGTSRYCRPKLDSIPARPSQGGFIAGLGGGIESLISGYADENQLSSPPASVLQEFADPFGVFDGTVEDPGYTEYSDH